MNLQTIQKRIEELSAELITISNDLSFLMRGEVSRPPAIVGAPVSGFTQLSEGDIIQIPHAFVDIDGTEFHAGSYKVESVERPGYAGIWDVEIKVNGNRDTWLNFSTLHNVVKV